MALSGLLWPFPSPQYLVLFCFALNLVLIVCNDIEINSLNSWILSKLTNDDLILAVCWYDFSIIKDCSLIVNFNPGISKLYHPFHYTSNLGHPSTYMYPIFWLLSTHPIPPPPRNFFYVKLSRKYETRAVLGFPGFQLLFLGMVVLTIGWLLFYRFCLQNRESRRGTVCDDFWWKNENSGHASGCWVVSCNICCITTELAQIKQGKKCVITSNKTGMC